MTTRPRGRAPVRRAPTGRRGDLRCPASAVRAGRSTALSRLHNGSLRTSFEPLAKGSKTSEGRHVTPTTSAALSAVPPREEQGVPAELRQARTAELVETEGFLRVTDLADRFGVSTVTVRSDLAALESAGRVRRVRGGAVASRRGRRGAAAGAPRPRVAARQKAGHRPALRARWCRTGDVVLLDVGSTTTAIAQALRRRARDLQRRHRRDQRAQRRAAARARRRRRPHHRSSSRGGTVRPLQHSLVNPLRHAPARAALRAPRVHRLQRRGRRRGRHQPQRRRGRDQARDGHTPRAARRRGGRHQARRGRGRARLRPRRRRSPRHRRRRGPRRRGELRSAGLSVDVVG